MRTCIYLLLVVFFFSCEKKNTLSVEEATSIIETSYPFKKCTSAVGEVYRLGLNQIELEAYEYKVVSPYPRGIIVMGRLKEIKGISISETNNNEATVLISVQYYKTPLYQLRGHKRFDRPSSCSLWKSEELEVVLIKYDTGWKVKK